LEYDGKGGDMNEKSFLEALKDLKHEFGFFTCRNCRFYCFNVENIVIILKSVVMIVRVNVQGHVYFIALETDIKTVNKRRKKCYLIL
jgi:hypothetical protein